MRAGRVGYRQIDRKREAERFRAISSDFDCFWSILEWHRAVFESVCSSEVHPINSLLTRHFENIHYQVDSDTTISEAINIQLAC